MALRARLYEKGVLFSKTLPCRVISIGNLVAGGTGKTPMTIHVAQILRDLGYRVVVVSRGYGGQLEKTGGIVSDGETILKGPEKVGDEPCLMAGRLKGIPVVVGSRRYEAGMVAVKSFNPDVIVLDDAFQHLRLNRDLNLVLMDHRSPFGNGHILPRGILREPVTALKRAHAILFTRSQEGEIPSRFDQVSGSLPIFHTRHIPVIRKYGKERDPFINERENISFLKGKKVVAFAGLANNDQFYNSLRAAGCDLLYTLSFSDHHRYDFTDLDQIVESTKSYNAEVLVTTLKDFVKLQTEFPWPVKLIVVDVQIEFFGDTLAFQTFITGFLANCRTT